MPDELLDIINDDNVVIAQEMRSLVHRGGLLHRGVHVFLVTPEGRLLLQQRSRNRETFPLALDCSVSEHVKAGESYLHAARRGLEEELGIQDAKLRALVKFKMIYGINDFKISLLYESVVDPALIRFDPVEVNEIAPYSPDELEALIKRGKPSFSSWTVQLIQWYLGKPSGLKLIRTYTHKRLLFSTFSGR